jgi:hypothetical protein
MLTQKLIVILAFAFLVFLVLNVNKEQLGFIFQ